MDKPLEMVSRSKKSTKFLHFGQGRGKDKAA